MIVYHYTSHESLTQIITSNELHPSWLNPQMDTAFGEGWYFTDLEPHLTPCEDLEMSLWMRREPVKSRTYLAFEIHDSVLQKCRPNVYRLRIDVLSDKAKIIRLNLTYTLTANGGQAIRFINHGHKQVIYKPYKPANPWNTFGVIALIGLGLLALTK